MGASVGKWAEPRLLPSCHIRSVVSIASGGCLATCLAGNRCFLVNHMSQIKIVYNHLTIIVLTIAKHWNHAVIVIVPINIILLFYPSTCADASFDEREIARLTQGHQQLITTKYYSSDQCGLLVTMHSSAS